MTIIEGQTTAEIDFSLIQGGMISGTVTTSDGQPLANICVNASSLCGETWYGGGQTDEDGHYSFVVPAGDYYIQTHASCEIPQDYVDEWWDGVEGNGTTNCNDALQVTVTVGQTTSGINLSLDQSGTISGNITRQDNGSSIPNLHVFATDYTTHEWVAGADTDQDGKYSLVLPSGIYRVRACASCSGLPYVDEFYDNTYNYDDADQVTVIALNDTADINFSLSEGGTISGNVTTSDGQPLANVCINASSLCGETWYGGGQTDENGNYAFVVPAGDYYIQTHASCEIPQEYIDEWWDSEEGTVDCNEATPVNVTEGQTTPDINFSLAQSGTPVTYSLTVEKDGTGSGTVTGDGINCGDECTKVYDENTTVTLTAQADSGSVFEGWSVEECGVQSECTITMNTAITIIATFNLSTGPGPGPGPGPVIPEPTTLLLLVTGLLGILTLVRRRNQKK